MGSITVLMFLLFASQGPKKIDDFTGSLLSEATVLGFAETFEKQKVLYGKKGNEFVPLYVYEVDSGYMVSFFKEFGPLIYNPTNQSVIFVAKHLNINDGQPSLFCMGPDYHLTILVTYSTRYRAHRFPDPVNAHIQQVEGKHEIAPNSKEAMALKC